MTAIEVESAVVRCIFSPRHRTVVPNVSWGWGLDYEADLIAVSPHLWTDEIEIKVSLSDLKADRHKHKHTVGGIDKRIKRFWYAVPTELVASALDEEIIETNFGVIEVWQPRDETSLPMAKIIRKAAIRPHAVKATQADVNALHRLGSLRYWDLRLAQVRSGRVIP